MVNLQIIIIQLHLDLLEKEIDIMLNKIDSPNEPIQRAIATIIVNIYCALKKEDTLLRILKHKKERQFCEIIQILLNYASQGLLTY